MKTFQTIRRYAACILVMLTSIGIVGQQHVDTEDLAELDLEDLMNMTVSSSSFFTLKSSETPGYIFNLDQSKAFASQSLIEQVRMLMPGMYDGSHTDTEIIGVRGIKAVDNSKTMVMFDGQNLNLRSNVGYGVGLSSKLLGDVKGIEVCLGPNAIVHGSGAISGYINMTPKNGYDNAGFFATVAKEFESNADNKEVLVNKVEAGYGFGTQKRNLYVYAGYYKTDGWQPDSSITMSGKYTYSALDGVRVNYTKNPNLRFSTHANFDGLTLNIGYMQNYRASKLGDQDNFERQFNAKLKSTTEFGDYESVDLFFSDEHSDLGRYTMYKEKPTVSGGSEAHLEGKAIFKTTRFNNNSLAVGALFGIRRFHAGNFFFGSDFDETITDFKCITDPNTGNSYANEKNKPDTRFLYASGQIPNGSWEEIAFFAEDIYKLNDKFVFALGLRYDRYIVENDNNDLDNLAPRFAFSYLINGSHVVKASYQQGFRTMDYYNAQQTNLSKSPWVECYTHKDGLNKDRKFNISIEPEKVHSVELNYHGDFASRMLSVDVNAYFNNYIKTIDFMPLATWTSDKYLADPDNYRGDFTKTGLKYFSAEDLGTIMYYSSNRTTAGKTSNFSAYVNNGENVKIVGGEVIATAAPTADTRINVIYSLQKPLTDSYAETSQCPGSQLKASATQYLFGKNLMLNAQFLFEPSLEDNAKNRAAYHDVYFTSRTMLDVAAAYTFAKHLTLQFAVNNLTAEERPGITYKPDMKNNYPQLTKLGENERQYWVSLKFAL